VQDGTGPLKSAVCNEYTGLFELGSDGDDCVPGCSSAFAEAGYDHAINGTCADLANDEVCALACAEGYVKADDTAAYTPKAKCSGPAWALDTEPDSTTASVQVRVRSCHLDHVGRGSGDVQRGQPRADGQRRRNLGGRSDVHGRRG
jgi:hypothetical protein